MADKRFLVFGYDNSKILPGLIALKDSFETEAMAVDWMRYNEYHYSTIHDRLDPSFKRFLIFAFNLDHKYNGGLDDLIGQTDNKSEAVRIALNSNSEHRQIYDRHEGVATVLENSNTDLGLHLY